MNLKSIIVVLMFISLMVLAHSAQAKPKKHGGAVGESVPAMDKAIYVGQDADWVQRTGPVTQITPDGELDMHFQLTHKFSEGDQLQLVTVIGKANDDDDDSHRRGTWASTGGAWRVVVIANGKNLNLGSELVLGRLSGVTKLDLYIPTLPSIMVEGGQI